VLPGHGSETVAAIVIVQLVALAPAASVTLTLKLPAVVGVPVIAPVVGFNVRLDGRVPTTVYV
jgi:hypothetical protein